MNTQPDNISEEKIDNIIRVLYKARILIIAFLALMVPLLYIFKVLDDDMIIWASIIFAFMAISDWFVIGHIIKKMEQARERIR